MKFRYLVSASLVFAVGTVQAGAENLEKANTILLACVTGDGLTYAVEIDEIRNIVLLSNTPATKVQIDKNDISFDINLAGKVYSHSISRLNGTATISSREWTTPITHTCTKAARKF